MSHNARFRVYVLLILAMAGLVIAAPAAWATPLQTRRGQTVPTPTPRSTWLPTSEPPAPTQSPPAPTPGPEETPGGPATATSPAPAPASLSLIHQVSPRLAWPGARVRYTLTLTNNGATSLRQIGLTSILPPELAPGDLLSGEAVWDGQTLRAETASLPPGGQFVVIFSATIRAGARTGKPIVNQATATAIGAASVSAIAIVALPPAELPPTGCRRFWKLWIADCGLWIDAAPIIRNRQL